MKFHALRNRISLLQIIHDDRNLKSAVTFTLAPTSFTFEFPILIFELAKILLVKTP